jgi:hypothetical protein
MKAMMLVNGQLVLYPWSYESHDSSVGILSWLQASRRTTWGCVFGGKKIFVLHDKHTPSGAHPPNSLAGGYQEGRVDHPVPNLRTCGSVPRTPPCVFIMPLIKHIGLSVRFFSHTDAISENNPRVIDDSRARKLAADLKRCSYYETCATYGLNVERVFQDGEYCTFR